MIWAFHQLGRNVSASRKIWKTKRALKQKSMNKVRSRLAVSSIRPLSSKWNRFLSQTSTSLLTYLEGRMKAKFWLQTNRSAKAFNWSEKLWNGRGMVQMLPKETNFWKHIKLTKRRMSTLMTIKVACFAGSSRKGSWTVNSPRSVARIWPKKKQTNNHIRKTFTLWET